MEPDPVLASNTREWLLRAKEDLDNAQHDLMATPPFVRDALFHCQQVVVCLPPRAARKLHHRLGERETLLTISAQSSTVVSWRFASMR
jgi:hypothetical protein